jgi:hypothetical protein
MTYFAATADKVSSARGLLFSGNMALAITTIALASAAVAWIIDPISWISNPAPLKAIDALSFDARFSPGSASNSLSKNFLAYRVAESLPPEVEIQLQEAKSRLARKLQSQDWQPTIIDESPKSIVIVVSLPKSRPIEAGLELRGGSVAAQADDRTLLQKVSDLLPARITLASLAPDGGLLGGGPDLSSLGYDNLTAVYDISAHTVYMPNRKFLSAFKNGEIKRLVVVPSLSDGLSASRRSVSQS